MKKLNSYKTKEKNSSHQQKQSERKKSLYNQILEIREEVEQAEKVKTCIEQLQEQKRQLSQVKRNELDL